MKGLFNKMMNKLFKMQQKKPKIEILLDDETKIDFSTSGIKFYHKDKEIPIPKVEIEKEVLEIKQKEKLFHKGNVYVFSRKLFKKHNKKDKHWSKKINGREVYFNDKFSQGTTIFKHGTVLVNREWCKCIQNNISRRKNK